MRGINVLAASALALAAPAVGATPAQLPEISNGLGGRSAAVNRSFIIGLWTDDDDCDHAVEFLPDGRYFSGGAGGIWQLDGNELTLTSGNILVVRVVPLDDDTIGVIGADGTVGESTRCETADMPAPGPDETA